MLDFAAHPVDQMYLTDLCKILLRAATDTRLHCARRREFQTTHDAIQGRWAQSRVAQGWSDGALQVVDFAAERRKQVAAATDLQCAFILHSAFSLIAGLEGWSEAESLEWQGRAQQAHHRQVLRAAPLGTGQRPQGALVAP